MVKIKFWAESSAAEWLAADPSNRTTVFNFNWLGDINDYEVGFCVRLPRGMIPGEIPVIIYDYFILAEDTVYDSVKLIKKDGTEYDLTKYVTFPITISDDLGEVMATAALNIPIVRSDSIVGLNLSEKIKPYERIEILLDNEIYRYIVMEDDIKTVKKGTPKLYSHTLTLVEPTEYLKHKNISGFTVTQPKDYVSILSESYGIDFVQWNTNTGIDAVPLTPVDIPFNVTLETNDPLYIEDLVLKQPGTYNLNLNFKFWYYSARLFTQQDTVYIKFYRDATLIGTEEIDISTNAFSSSIKKYEGSSSFTFETTSVDETISVKIYHTNDAVEVGFDEAFQSYVNLYLWTQVESAAANIYLDETIDKVFNLIKIHDINNTNFNPEFSLGGLTRGKIFNILTPELGFDKVSAFDILNVLASYVKAVPRLGLDDFTTLEFDYIDPEKTETFEITDYMDKEVSAMLDNYSNAMEINADNVVQSDSLSYKVEPYEKGWMSVRTNGEGPIELTDDTAAIVLKQNIYRIIEVKVKGIQVTTNNRTLPSSTEYDITEYIAEKKRYDGFEPQLNRSVVGSLTKGNTMYYEQGANRILNLGYTAPTDPALYSFVERALFEAIYDKVLQLYPTDTITPYDQNQSNYAKFEDVLFRIKYIPMSEIRSLVKKYNILDDDYQIESYVNESAKLIDINTMGEYTRTMVNRAGNDVITYSGAIRDLRNLPDIGYKDSDNNIVSTYSLSVVSPTIKTYSLQLQKDFSGVNPLVKLTAPYRQYQVPDDEVVYRQDIYNEAFIVSKTDITNQETIYTVPNSLIYFPYPFLTPLTTFPSVMKPVSYCRFSIKNKGTDLTSPDLRVDLPVETKAVGTSMIMKVQMKDNYSVGSILKQVDPAKTYQADDSAVVQYELPYGDVFGTFDSARVELYTYGSDVNTWPDAQLYPLYNFSPTGQRISQLDLNVLKDAREKYGVVQQIDFVSNDNDNLRVYSGFAKYNGWVHTDKETHIPKIVLLKGNYFPSINSNYVDRTRTEDATMTDWTSSLFTLNGYRMRLNNTIQIQPNTEYNGYALINSVTDELIYAVKKYMYNDEATAKSYTDYVYIIPKFIS